jgi:hypothetical protein
MYIILQREKVIKKSQQSRNPNFLTIFAWWWKDPDPEPYLTLTDPDPDAVPGGPKIYGSYGVRIHIGIAYCLCCFQEETSGVPAKKTFGCGLLSRYSFYGEVDKEGVDITDGVPAKIVRWSPAECGLCIFYYNLNTIHRQEYRKKNKKPIMFLRTNRKWTLIKYLWQNANCCSMAFRNSLLPFTETYCSKQLRTITAFYQYIFLPLAVEFFLLVSVCSPSF